MEQEIATVNSGIAGLDTLLNGGYARGRLYLVRGQPGTGKSLTGQHFLQAGIEQGERVVYIHGEESRQDILTNATQLGIDLSEAEFLDLGPDTDFFTDNVSYDLVDPVDIESERFIDEIREVIDALDPSRIFIDPITQIEYVEADKYQYRKRLLSLMRFLRDRDTTVLATRIRSSENIDTDIESLCDGLIHLRHDERDRRVSVPKHRGLGQRSGDHGLEIRADGIEVYPQLLPGADDRTFDPELLSSGLEDLDTLLGGGVDRGSVTFISGPTGIGKSTTATQFVDAITQQDGHSLVYLFEESTEQFTYRGESLSYPIEEYEKSDALTLREIEPVEYSAEEFGQQVSEDVVTHQPDVVVVDGIDGYKVSLHGDESRLVDRLHSLTRYLKNRGVTVVLTDEVTHITGMPSATSTNTSYIADNIVFLSYVEIDGGLERVMGVLKKRLGGFETQFRRFDITEDEGVQIGSTLNGVDSILGGSPRRSNGRAND